MRALLAEDDEKLGRLVKNFLEEENFQTDWVKNGKDAVYYALHAEYDVLILDWMMPDDDGIGVCRKLREAKSQIGILMLTAKDMIEDRVTGLDAGADDYLVKPFAFAELLARIRAVLRRSEQRFQGQLLQVGDLALDRGSYHVTRSGKAVELTNRESQVLEVLMVNAGMTVTREQLLERIWGLDGDVTPNNLEVYINYLRKKLELPANPVPIKTVRGIGYKLESSHV